MDRNAYSRLEEEHDMEFKKWKDNNDVKDFPMCKVMFEKSYSCNHIECVNCKARICWMCLETFETGGECYGHMQEVHDSYHG